MSKPIYLDLGDEVEDTRIRQIGDTAMKGNKIVGFVVDAEGNDQYAKADRYIAKLQARYSGIRIMGKGLGPVEATVWVKVGPPLS